jgi:lysozyme
LSVISSNKWLIGGASTAAIGALIALEGERYEPYADLGGVYTVCAGVTGPAVIRGKRYSKQECNELTKTAYIEHGKGVLSCITRPLNENQYNAFTIFAYNIGVAGFCKSRAARLFNQGQEEAACNAIAYAADGKTPVWSFVGTTFYKGLHNRRLIERNICLGKHTWQQGAFSSTSFWALQPTYSIRMSYS